MPYENGKTIGKTGSENGEIVCDEEYDGSSRITLEKCKRYWAITCGIYGAMVHTAFCDEHGAYPKYEAMKKDLQDFLCSTAIEDEGTNFYETFVDKY